MNSTISKRPAFQPTNDMILAAEAVFKAMTTEELVRPVVESYQKAILLDGKFPVAAQFNPDGLEELITNPKHSYLMEESDWAIYAERCDVARMEAKLEVKIAKNCPLCEAEFALLQTQWKLIEVMEGVTGLTRDKVCGLPPASFKKFIELTLRLLAPFVKNTLR